MLKAVRFDEEEHAELIKFMEEYRDKKNRPNHSEAIRYLMLKGLEYINNKETEKQPSIDVESLKNEIFGQIMSQIQNMNINPPTTRQEPKQEEVQQLKPKPKPLQPKIDTSKIDNNPLLANILGNANR